MQAAAAIRRLGPADRGAFRDHLLRLDAVSRRDRFAMDAGDAFLERYAVVAFVHDGAIFGWFEDGRIRAAAELRPMAGRAVEAAFTVEPAHRGKGVATALFERIVADARSLGARRIYMSCLAHNLAVQALARKFAAEFIFEPADLLTDDTPSAVADRLPQHAAKTEDFATAIVKVDNRWRPFQSRR